MRSNRPVTDKQVICTVNGPGEISGWLYPFANILKMRNPGVRVCAAVLPSVFRSGGEARVLKSLPAVDALSTEKDTLRLIYRGRVPVGFVPGKPGCLIHFGGEPFLSWMLARRFGYPLLFYGEGVPRPHFWFRKVYLTEKSGNVKKGIPENRKIIPIGNLMVDAALMRCGNRRSSEGGDFTIGLFPGSRHYQVKHMLPFMLKVARLTRIGLGKPEFIVARAHFLDLETLGQVAGETEGRLLDGDSAVLEQDGSSTRLVSEYGISVDIETPEKVMARIDLALTVPGTNTAELAALGIPMMVLLPSQKPELYPMPGPAGHLHRIPLVGKYLKTFLLWLFWKRVKYFAHPNRRTKREVVPEVVGKVSAEEIAKKLLNFSHTPLGEVEVKLQAIMGAPGAAGRLADEVLHFLHRETSLP